MSEPIFDNRTDRQVISGSPRNRDRARSEPTRSPGAPRVSSASNGECAYAHNVMEPVRSDRPEVALREAIERLNILLEQPLRVDETAALGFARKELEIRQAFAELSVSVSRELHRRLSNPREGDALAAAFLRLAFERRVRLINFLADARRRAALKR